jgi:DNA-binding LytR/AlgR family response regulator
MKEPFNILIVEDETLYANKLEMQVDKLGHKLVGVADNSERALELVDTYPIDLILMDIFIDGQYDGVELAELIQARKDIAVLFITSQTDALSFNRASRTQPVGFLLKPFSDLQLQRSIQLALDKVEASDIDTPDALNATDNTKVDKAGIYIKKKQKLVNVNFADIFYIQSDGRYCRIHTEMNMYLIRSSMKDLKKRLPENIFIKCHRSYLVNLSKIKSIDLENDFVVLQEMKVPLSRREKENLLEKLDFLI